MRTVNRATLMLIPVLLALASASAFGDGVSITINNNTTDDLLVTVYDLNTAPVQRVVSSSTISGFATISVTVTADDSGQGHLWWTATSGDRSRQVCGHHEKSHLNSGDTVRVYANFTCA